MNKPASLNGRKALRSLAALFALVCIFVSHARGRENAAGFSIVLPPRIVAGEPATLAALDPQKKLAPGVTVELFDAFTLSGSAANGRRVRTDDTGRASFQAPSQSRVLIARVFAGASAACLVETDAEPSPPSQAEERGLEIVRAPVKISLHEDFVLHGRGFAGQAGTNHLQIAGERALVLAASPVALVAMAGPQTPPGNAIISLEASGAKAAARTTVVALDANLGAARLRPSTKAKMLIRVRGTDERVLLDVRNLAPATARLQGGDHQQIRTRGGKNNTAQLRVASLRSGDFSFRVEPRDLAPDSPDAAAAAEYLRAALPLASASQQKELDKLADRLRKHPRDTRKAQVEVAKLLARAPSGDFRLLLESARDSLSGR